MKSTTLQQFRQWNFGLGVINSLQTEKKKLRIIQISVTKTVD